MNIEYKKKLKEVETNEQLFTFICETNYDEQPKTKKVVQFDGITLSDIVYQFEEFLKGCGFSFEGELDFVDKKL